MCFLIQVSLNLPSLLSPQAAQMKYSYTRVRDKRNSLCQLPRSGWPIGRAGLGATATYPAKVVCEQSKAEGLGLFTFELPVWGKPMAKNNVIHQWYLPSYPSIDWATAAVNVKRPRPSALFYYSICKTG